MRLAVLAAGLWLLFAAPAAVRMARDGNAFDPVPVQLPPSDQNVDLSDPGWDAQGRMWIGFSSPGASAADRIAEVDRIAPDGSIAERLPVVGQQYPAARRVGF